jgi:uncharacterized phiE125 gp8 family phage protein
MAALIVQTQPTQEPITLAQARIFLRVSITDDDALITALIAAAREEVEHFTGRSFAIKSYLQALDSFPYFVDTVLSQNAYPPSYYSYPMYATSMWNYSQMIKLFRPPCIAVQGIDYTDAGGANQTLEQDTNFILDNVSEPARIFPMPGAQWPPCLYAPNAVRIRYTAGYGSSAVDATPVDGELAQGAGSQPMPQRAILAMYQLLASWYENRESITPQTMKALPHHVEMLLWSLRVMDMSPTRG